MTLNLATTMGARARYTRVWVEIDLSKPLFGRCAIDDRSFFIEHDSLELICFTCGIYGHKEAQVIKSRNVTPVPNQPE
ncbi:hypothetical protein LINPERHAP1_LOCUS22304 [Linum perenne]